MRAIMREKYRPYHDVEILQSNAEAAAKILAVLDAQRPLSSLEFEDRVRYGDPGSWRGTTLTKRILRSLWACGLLVTHHRKGGRHYYNRPERVIPAQHYATAPLLDEDAYHRRIITRQIQATGLLRLNAEACIWSACGDAAIRKQAIAQLVEEGTLIPINVEGKSWTYYMLISTLPLLDAPPPASRAIFIGPLDSILWDRKGVQHLFDFDYLWEVYTPAAQRRWGYYVLPVFYGDRFIARLDSRAENGVWTISRWWWEPDVVVDDELLAALNIVMKEFLYYLRATDIYIEDLTVAFLHLEKG